MRKQTSGYIFFFLIAIVLFNPLWFFLFYNDKHSYNYPLINGLFYIVPIVFIIGAVLVYKNKLNPVYSNLIFGASVVIIAFSLFSMGNSAIGLLLFNDKTGEGLIFSPNTSVNYKTGEFDFNVYTNSLGLRDNEIDPEKGNKYRICAIGDSWTFGWGAEIEESWPKQLEVLLNENGSREYEVINCGQPGQFPETYLLHLKKILPVLKPDMVILGFLQEDDLAQIYENKVRSETKSAELPGIIYQFKVFIVNTVDNVRRLAGGSNKETYDVRKSWKKSATSMLAAFSESDLQWYTDFDDTLKQYFETGNLNPGLMSYYIHFRENYEIFNNPDHESTRFATARFKDILSEIKDFASDYNTKLIFANLPLSHYTGHKVIRAPISQAGSEAVKSKRVDMIFRSLADSCELPYIELTEHFELLPDKDKYFYRFDGHPTPEGYSEIAKGIYNFLK